MAFPADPLPIKQELLINGVWTDITSRTRSSDNVSITRGYSSEQAALSAAQCSFTLNNRDGRFSNRNPISPYYRQTGRNTQYRVGVTETTPWLPFRDYSVVSTGTYDGASCSTADKAALDVVGDIDVRIDVEADNWRTNTGYILVGKYNRSSNQRSWVLRTSRTNFLQFAWSTDGSATPGATFRTATSTAQVPTLGRVALRAVLDVDNGASGCTVTFYTAPTIGGTYTQLGAPVTFSGVTSIYSSSALLEVASIDNAGRGDVFADVVPFVGRIYTMEMRNGIAGTLVAKMDATVRNPGDQVWADGLGNTWQTALSALVTNTDYRFWGEVSKLPQRWDTSGQDVWVPVQAADMIQRLSQGEKALESPIFRNLSQYQPAGYWPMESGATNGAAFSSYTGRAGQLVSGNFGNDVTLPGTAGVLTFTDDAGYASAIANVQATTTIAYMLFYFKLPSVPLSQVDIMSFYLAGGGSARVTFSVSSGTYTITVVGFNGVTLFTETVGFGAQAPPTGWVGMRARLTTSGLNTTVAWGWYGIGANVFYGGTGGTTGAESGRVRSWISYPYTGKAGMSIAHVVMANKDIGFVEQNFYGSTNGYIGETAGARAQRLSKEQNVPFWLVGNFGSGWNEPMGAQGTNTYLELLKDCAELAGAILYSPRDKFGIAMRTRNALVNQGSTSLSYTSKHFSGSIEPDEDDSLIRNDVTVSRPNGGFGRVVKTAGSLNTGDPASSPDSVGTYDTSIVLNAQTDARLLALAGREVSLGTWDELRYTKVMVELERAPYVSSASLTRSVRALDLGDPFTITGLPKWLPPDDVELMIIGYTETLKNRGQSLVWNTRPYGPFRVNDLTLSGTSHYRAAANNCTVGTAMNTTVGTLSIATAAGSSLWSTSAVKPGNFPLDIFVAGERMTITALTGTSSPQSATVTRSVNGVVKSHLVGETVQVADPFYVTL